jgi:hypothetical protein
MPLYEQLAERTAKSHIACKNCHALADILQQFLGFARVSPMPHDTRRVGDHAAVYCRPYGIRRRRKTQLRTLTFVASQFSRTSTARAGPVASRRSD